jgi:hypothetical protein
MSWRVSVSFNNREKHLKDNYDNKGKSNYVKMCMNFYEEMKDKLFIVHDNTPKTFSNLTNMQQKKDIKKMIK